MGSNNFFFGYKAKFLALGIACMYSAGCGLLVTGKKEADRLLAQHFQALSSASFTNALTNYSASFFTNSSQAQWTTTLSNLTANLGTYQDYSSMNLHVHRNRTQGVGTNITITIGCVVTYSKGTATERFTFAKGPADAEFKITAHTIVPDKGPRL